MPSVDSVLAVLAQIERGEVTLTPEGPEAPGDVGWGSASYVASNGWRVVVFVDSYGFDYIESVEDKTGVQDSDALLPYYPPDDVVERVYGLRA